nr:MAG TPA: hypothetical protein [Caudoviricetes sp.]
MFSTTSIYFSITRCISSSTSFLSSSSYFKLIRLILSYDCLLTEIISYFNIIFSTFSKCYISIRCRFILFS